MPGLACRRADAGHGWWRRVLVDARPTRRSTAQIRSIAVLPFQNLSRDPDQEFFADGTTETLISSLAQIHALDVTSRTSVMRYKGTTKTLREIARELGVDAIVEGSVQYAGGRVRVTAQLIRASTDTHLWASDYDRDASDFLQMEADVARAIAQEIEVQITPEESRRLASARSIRPDAQEAFLLGRYHFFKNGRCSRVEAGDRVFRAGHPAPTGLRRCLRGAVADVGESERRGECRAKCAEGRGARSQTWPKPSAAMGGIKAIDWDWAGAEKDFRQALELNPDSLETCYCFCEHPDRLGPFR